MSRSNYSDDLDEDDLEAYRALVRDVIDSPKGQSFLRELATAMDAMGNKFLIADELVAPDGSCCAIGVVCKSRDVDTRSVDPECPTSVGNLVGIAHELAAEIEYINDECGQITESPENRWVRVRKWVASQLSEVGQ